MSRGRTVKMCSVSVMWGASSWNRIWKALPISFSRPSTAPVRSAPETRLKASGTGEAPSAFQVWICGGLSSTRSLKPAKSAGLA